MTEVVTHWASCSPAITDWLAESVEWFVGGQVVEPRSGVAAIEGSDVEVRRLEIRLIITHGREAACEGTYYSTVGATDFCHMIRFTGVGRTAKISEVRTYRA